ncbi:hypothetical protein EDC26_102166 [Paralcaligenes ureilyticus]|uniref:Uncharacterized protein n=1 Tax=Paralcaligenes ureilyticus TaxID=627131 RepID=A0A4R3M9T9_9BURK|nr:hypothetical protein EDC26_102166 [Paralcaligenes ureilyticus]
MAAHERLITDIAAALAASEAQRSAMWTVRHSVSEGNKKAGVDRCLLTRAGALLRRAELVATAHRLIKLPFYSDLATTLPPAPDHRGSALETGA